MTQKEIKNYLDCIIRKKEIMSNLSETGRMLFEADIQDLGLERAIDEQSEEAEI